MKTVEENILSVVKKDETELSRISQTNLSAQTVSEVQGALILAKRFPRNEDQSYEKLLRSCKRLKFAENANYSFPRGGIKITGPSVNLAREAARTWSNIEYGHVIVSDDAEERHIRAWAWDKETNVRIFEEDAFKKLIYRKKEGWIKPDERDLRELTNRRAAILKRNCILQLIPRDFIEDAQEICKKTIEKRFSEDPDKAKKDIIKAFSVLNITPDMLEEKLGHAVSKCSPNEIVELREIYQSITDGNSSWSEYINNKEIVLKFDELLPKNIDMNILNEFIQKCIHESGDDITIEQVKEEAAQNMDFFLKAYGHFRDQKAEKKKKSAKPKKKTESAEDVQPEILPGETIDLPWEEKQGSSGNDDIFEKLKDDKRIFLATFKKEAKRLGLPISIDDMTRKQAEDLHNAIGAAIDTGNNY